MLVRWVKATLASWNYERRGLSISLTDVRGFSPASPERNSQTICRILDLRLLLNVLFGLIHQPTNSRQLIDQDYAVPIGQKIKTN